MPLRFQKKVLGINGVAPGQKASVKLDTGVRVHGMELFVTDNGVASYSKLKEVTVSVRGQVMQRLALAELIALYEENFNTANPGHVPLAFSEPTRTNSLNSEVTAYDMAGETDFQLTAEFDPTAVNPTLEILQSFDRGQYLDPKTGLAIKRPIRRNAIYHNPGAGWFDIPNLPNRNPIAAIRINTTTTPTAGDILEYEVRLDNEVVQEGTYDQNVKALEAQGYDGTKFVLPIIFSRDHSAESGALDPRIRDAAGNIIGYKTLVVRVRMASAKGIKIITDEILSGFGS